MTDKATAELIELRKLMADYIKTGKEIEKNTRGGAKL
jgi:hypothetical protein